MRKIQYSLIILVAILNTSGGIVPPMGLLTDDYGIITEADLEEDEEKCMPEPFPPKGVGCFPYWVCLNIQEVTMRCDDLGEIGDYQHTGQADFWIRDGANVHHYYTRRNFDIEVCEDWIEEWQAVIRGENTVCLSGEFLEIEDVSAEDDTIERHYHWIIDRMKSRHGEWSYFARGDD